MTARHSYPSKYGPGVHWAIDEAWTILDRLPVGMLPDDYRNLVAGEIAGALIRHASGVASIACPKCGRVSYHPKDVEERFCVVCGFHNSTETDNARD